MMMSFGFHKVTPKTKTKTPYVMSHDYFSMNLVGRGHAQLISSNG